MAASTSERIVLSEEDVPGAKLKKLPRDCTVLELNRWLECHGLHKKGNKTELVERVNLSMGKIKVDPKVDGGKSKINPRENSVSTKFAKINPAKFFHRKKTRNREN